MSPPEIRYVVGQSALGAVLVAASPRGLCAIALGDEPGPLVDDLLGATPGAEADPAGLATELGRVVALIADPRVGLDLPLDPGGTDFQRRVWELLGRIPVGHTRTYTELATELGGGASANRAVAGACAANPLAVAIPCHRVLRADGGISGYRWGVERKRALLWREAGGTWFSR